MEQESYTRSNRIDQQLRSAGWLPRSQRLLEEFVLKATVEGDCTEFADYALLDQQKAPIAIVEAKRSSRSALEGERQAADYARRIAADCGTEPFVFLANGNEIWFWDSSLYPPRKVSGFYSPGDLDRLRFIRSYRQPLGGADVDVNIAGRAYQIEAIKTIAERIETSRRRFLLVMATGTGKTRTVIALIELLLRRKWIQRVLFLADRRELVKQALDAFKEHLPQVPRGWVESGEVDPAARVLAATYPGMMATYQRLSPGYFDLIVADESHRSIYNRYKAILDHFDSIHVGLTATPTDFIDHNTFELFECEDGLPTFHYSYDEAIHDGHLVPYRPVHVAKTGFQVEGLKPGTLPPEIAKELKEQGIEPSELDFEGTDFEKRITNTGTNDAIVREFMDVSIKDAVGTLPGKTIIFAVSHNHALELYQSFNRLYPDLQRRGLAKVIDSRMERADKTLDDFKNRDFPRVAISVDMLDTGIDVPAIRNLVFAKPVFSQVKFWQMIGRGTRPWKDPLSGKAKKDFLIIDHWDNFAYFQVNPAGHGETPAAEPLPTRTFRLRVEAMEILAGRGEAELAQCECNALRAMLRDVPLDNVNVAPHADEIRHLIDKPDAWLPLDEAKYKHLVLTIAPLLRFSSASGYTTLQFENLTQSLAVAALKAEVEEIQRLRVRTLENLSLLPHDLPEIRAVADELNRAMSDEYWQPVDYERVIHIHRVFSPVMRFRARRETGQLVRLSVRDEIRDRHWIIFGPSGEGAFADTYRQQVEAFVRDLAEQSPALQKLREGGTLSDYECDEIGHVLERPDLFITEERLRELYHQPSADLRAFLGHILGIAALPSREKQVSEAFDGWVTAHPKLNATQLMFVRTLRQAVLSRAQVRTVEQLHQSPFTRIGDPEKLFDRNTLKELIKLAAESAA
ncbi:MAG: DEAD/DEAH box helicase family protein [Planctomycetaceae bacterium]|nr:DEAD/DEAH box helicase family protein [Planctomycetaceae bacterium]